MSRPTASPTSTAHCLVVMHPTRVSPVDEANASYNKSRAVSMCGKQRRPPLVGIHVSGLFLRRGHDQPEGLQHVAVVGSVAGPASLGVEPVHPAEVSSAPFGASSRLSGAWNGRRFDHPHQRMEHEAGQPISASRSRMDRGHQHALAASQHGQASRPAIAGRPPRPGTEAGRRRLRGTKAGHDSGYRECHDLALGNRNPAPGGVNGEEVSHPLDPPLRVRRRRRFGLCSPTLLVRRSASKKVCADAFGGL